MLEKRMSRTNIVNSQAAKQKRTVSSRLALLALLVGLVLLAAVVDRAYAVTQTTIASSGLTGAIGSAIDHTANQLYFVDWNAGALKRMDLPPSCSPCDSSITTIAAGLSHPEDVQLDVAGGFAYVTTRDDPATTGALWKINLATSAATRISVNLGAPQQLVLRTSGSRAYVVGFDDGRLRRINLTTSMWTVLASGLVRPVGIAVTDDEKYAYVTEQDLSFPRLTKVDLTTGVKVPIVYGFTEPFFLTWADHSQNALYVTERDPANRVSRVNLITKARNDAITGLPWRPSGTAMSNGATPIYVTTDGQIVKVDMVDFTGPVFMGIGHVPASKIVDGFATTDPGYFFQVKHAPFGGTLNFFGNLTNFNALGATHYQILVSKDGGPFTALNLSWNAYKWNSITLGYDLTPMAPDSGTTKYFIPVEGDGLYHPELWYPPFLFMQWPSGLNGLYTFMVQISDEVNGIDLTSLLPPGLNTLRVRIDNTPPDVKIDEIWQVGSPDRLIRPCDIISSGLNRYYFKITAYDPEHHLLSYGLGAVWGDNHSASIPGGSDSYNAHVNAEGPYLWSGVGYQRVPATFWSASCNCAHTFTLGAWKRTINGYNYILYREYHKSITINNTGGTCSP